MTITGCYKKVQGFKIRKISDIRKFLDEILMSGEWNIICDKYTVLNIEKDKSGTWRIGVKAGHIYDPFNPVFVLSEAHGIRKIWEHRKHVNKHFFSER